MHYFGYSSNILPGRSPLELRECPAPMGEGVYHAPGYNEGAENGMSSTSAIGKKVGCFEICCVFILGNYSQLYLDD